ncbi:DUF5663 domain-containing protein [Streptomyces sp. NPDC005573]|uniref:DUF5663 domain-containing protein n=1 Tax=Streptomyces sp. NPDC005573 TaxID=3156890 RepID=UPI0033BA8F64
MIALDDALLREIGLGELPEPHVRLMLRYIYEVLEQRVGLAFAEEMTEEEFEEFEAFIDANDEAGAMDWLSRKRPDYPEVVAAQFEKLKGELRDQATALVRVSGLYMSEWKGAEKAEDDVAQPGGSEVPAPRAGASAGESEVPSGEGGAPAQEPESPAGSPGIPVGAPEVPAEDVDVPGQGGTPE